jgi:2-oxoglutarate ferredoxin oxidoreductase subunit delta
MNRVEINTEACKGCRLCIRACPKKILEISTTKRNAKGYSPVECINPRACSACRSCALTCPDVCITIFKEGGKNNAGNFSKNRYAD